MNKHKILTANRLQIGFLSDIRSFGHGCRFLFAKLNFFFENQIIFLAKI